jgi:hypothetical protein
MNIGSLVSGAMGLFGHHKSPSKEAGKIIGGVPSATAPHTAPWEESGKNVLPNLEEQYTQSMTNPGGKYNDIGSNYKESPGYKFALQQALQGGNNAAAAGGMAGSPQHEQEQMELAQNLANQDYYNYMEGATDIYKTGLTGGQNLSNQGQEAGKTQSDYVAQTMAQQANLKRAQEQEENERKNKAYTDIAQGIFY